MERRTLESETIENLQLLVMRIGMVEEGNQIKIIG